MRTMTLKNFFRIFLFFGFQIPILAWSQKAGQTGLNIPFEKYQLSNGLTVVLHVDKSDPMVAVAIQYHVGSNREVKGKTGFAHLFEHIMFQRSENVGEDQFFRKIQNAGGDLNGGTGNDGTVYYEVVPKNALELVLWLESDRMGYLLNTVTPSSFANQQNVVQNEKRQRMDNAPYGFTNYVIDKNLFPDGHPYSWQVIGEMEDLQNATIDDVKNFYRKYYIPGNATLVIAGDINPAEVKGLVEKYFGEIPAGNSITDLPKMDVSLDQTKRLYHEDNFANAPRLTIVWPTIHEYTNDAYALDFLGELLSGGKKSPLYKVLIEEKQLAPRVMAYNNSMELAGKFTISVMANPGVDLDDVESAINEAFERFEKEGFTEKDVERIKAKLETQFYQGISSVLMKAFNLARYNEYAGDPGYIEKDLASLMAVTQDDIWRVYRHYIKGKNYVMASFVPKGKPELATQGSIAAGIKEENVEQAMEAKPVSSGQEEAILKTPTRLDRSIEPPLGPEPVVTPPKIWKAETKNGISITGIEQTELPLVQFSLIIKGGQTLDDPAKPGVANLVALMMKSGTREMTAQELEEAIELLGSSINIYAAPEAIVFDVSCLDRNFEKTLDLLGKMIFEPRWDSKEFEIYKKRTINTLIQRKASPEYQAQIAYNQILFGKDHILSFPVAGTESSVALITLDDVKKYYSSYFAPNVVSFQIAGSPARKRILSSMKVFEKKWPSGKVVLPAVKSPVIPEKPVIYFVDVPGAKQSVIRVGCPGIPRNHPDFYPVTIMNYRLGGNFNSVLNMILREEKGYTYGASSYFTGMKNFGLFAAGASVRSNTTEESLRIFHESIQNYPTETNDEDLAFTKNALLRSNAMNFETLSSLVDILDNIAMYNLPVDYVQKEVDILQKITLDEHHALAKKYLNPERMIYVIAGDAATQLPKVQATGIGEVVKYGL
ncbi:MAG: M16 family metallopeptidase [Bacteroidales bacterium]